MDCLSILLSVCYSAPHTVSVHVQYIKWNIFSWYGHTVSKLDCNFSSLYCLSHFTNIACSLSLWVNMYDIENFLLNSVAAGASVFHKQILLWILTWFSLIQNCKRFGITCIFGSVPVDFLRPKFSVAHTKHDVISILMNEYTYINMYIIKKIISCIFILCWDITALLKLKRKFAGYV